MNFFRNHIVSKIFCFVFAMHIFNICIDTPDAQPDWMPEDLSVNDIESVVEFILEDVLKINNAIAEHDEADNQDGNTLEMKKANFFFQNFSFKLIIAESTSAKVASFDYKTPFYLNKYNDILIQPPEA